MPASRKPPRPKTAVRKTVKWGGLVVSVLLLVVWIGSAWWHVEWSAMPDHYEYVERGVLEVNISRPSPPDTDTPLDPTAESATWWDPGWYWSAAPRLGLDWSFERPPSPFEISLRVPLWFPTLLSLLATTFAWRADSKSPRRVRAGLCPACGYGRAGLAAGAVCPECGAAAGAR